MLNEIFNFIIFRERLKTSHVNFPP